MGTRIAGPCFILLVSAVLTACGAKQPAPKATPPPDVNTVSAREGNLAASVEIAGVITPYRQIAVAADLNEPISRVSVIEGDVVSAGQVLATQDVDDLNSQLISSQRTVAEDQARLAQTVYTNTASTSTNVNAVKSAEDTLRQAQVNLAGAETDLRRYASLVGSGYIPAQTVDQQRVTVEADRQAVSAAQSSYDAAIVNNKSNGNGYDAGAQQQDIEAARAAVDAAQATVAQLKAEIARAVIVAPVAGIVESVNANPGEYPSARQLFTIEQIDRVYAVLPASTAQVLSIRPGAGASVEVNTSYNADPHASKDHGTVDAVLDQIEPGTTNFTVKVVVNNSDHHLRSGMPVDGFVDLPVRRGIIVPTGAFIDNTHTTLYTVDDGVVHQKTVREVDTTGARSIVTGISQGEAVVADAAGTTVGNGDRVRATPEARPTPKAGP